jgi:small subunit ribosomal protein S14
MAGTCSNDHLRSEKEGDEQLTIGEFASLQDAGLANCQLPIANCSSMATTAKIAKTNKKPKFSTQHRNRCSICGRPRGYLRKFGVCRLCFRGLALKGEVPGVSKSSW